MSKPSYKRAPSRVLQRLLAAGGFLAPLLDRRKHSGIDLEVHLRPGNQVHLYCGLTCLVKSGASRNGAIWVESHDEYAAQQCADSLFRPGRARPVGGGAYRRDVWSVDEAGFPEALDRFLDDVKVGSRQTKEGAVQARWSKIETPWIVFDKEAALSYPSMEERSRQLAEAFHPAVDEARDQLRTLALARRSLSNSRHHWEKPPEPKSRLKLDALAVDPEGNLVLLEVKDASGSEGEVYYSPFQILQNVWEWHYALNAVRASLQSLLDARVALGLTPDSVPRISGGLRAAIGFGADERREEVRSRYLEVLGIVNALLPQGVSSIETWALANGKPVRLG